MDLHLGVHKTATTYIQEVLRANSELLTRKKILVPHHRTTRRFLTIPCQLKAYERIGQKRKTRLTDLELQLIVENFFGSLDVPNDANLLLSDENFLGHCGHVVRSGILYSRKVQFLTVLKEHLPEPPMRIFMCFRDYKDYFSSVYMQYLLDVSRENYVAPEDFADKVLARAPSWVSLASTIQDVFPSSELVVWSYEKVQGNWREVFSQMLGPEVARDLNLVGNKTFRRSMPDSALRKFLALADREGIDAALASLPKLHKEFRTKPDAQSVQIFDDKQIEVLDRRFRKHSDKLETAGLNLRSIL
jgi:hypothetical protein